jgi:2-methylcitrate synthase
VISDKPAMGLRGQSAGQTAICTLDAEGNSLRYRGFDIVDLASRSTFHETAFLILKGYLPDQHQLDSWKSKLKDQRRLPRPMQTLLERIPADAHPMDVMRTACSFLGNIEAEEDFSRQSEVADRMLAIFPSIIAYWYRFSHDGVRIETQTDEDTVGGHFLHMLHGRSPDELTIRALEVSLTLYAELEFNASTFTARVCASTMSDLHSCITAAIGALRGPLHGGANEAVMAMIQQYSTVEEAAAAVRRKLAARELVMGFGHAIYRVRDPRTAIIKDWSGRLAAVSGNERLFEISAAIERVMKEEKNMFANVDFFHASTYHFLGIPTRLFTPLFVMSRVTGWAAHCFEQRAHNRIIGPIAEYIGPAEREYVPIELR